MDPKIKALQEERQKRIATTLRYEKADRIPLVAWRSDYMVNYFGLQQRDMDFESEIDVYIRGNMEFDWDVCDVSDPFNPTYGARAEILRGSVYHINDDRNAVQIDPSVIEIMPPEEYDAFIADPLHHLADVVYPRRYKIWSHDVSKEEKFAALEALDALGAKSGAYRKKISEETGFIGSSHIFFSVPIDYIFDDLRNMTGIAKDIRRCPEKVIAASDMLIEYTMKDVRMAPRIDYSSATAALHLAPFLKPKDFEKVYWPYFRRLVEESFSLGHRSKMLFEKSWKHVFDYLDDLPDNCLIGYFEKEDGFGNCVKRFGPKKQIVVGGIESDLLARGTKEQVIEQVRYNIDNYCGDGGVMLAPDLPLIYKVDAKPENYKAAMETVRKYGDY